MYKGTWFGADVAIKAIRPETNWDTGNLHGSGEVKVPSSS